MSYNLGTAYMRKQLGLDMKTTFTKEEKAKRKHSINVLDYMQTRDNILGMRPTPPPLIVHHPRAFNPPLSCRDGHHIWETGVIMGIPRLKCKKCGHIVMKGSFEGTETKREIRERFVPKPMPIESALGSRSYYAGK